MSSPSNCWPAATGSPRRCAGQSSCATSPPGTGTRLWVRVLNVTDTAQMRRVVAALAPDPPRRLLLGSDAYRLVHAALAARLAEVEGQRDQAAATDVDSWPGPNP